MSLEWRLPGRDGLLPHRCRRLPTLSRGAYGGVSDFPPANGFGFCVLALVGFFLVFAGNPTGTAASQAEAPGVPQYVQISPGQSEELAVSWNAPASDGGSAITGYKMQWKETAGSWDTPADVSETTVTGKTYTITGLTDGLEYAVRVIAVNDIGDGPPSSEETCPGGGYGPDPTPVEVDAVPIVVTSTTDDYFVLYVSHDVDGKEVEWPVLVKRGESGTTTLAENLEALPAERYRVEKYLVADPADVDGDCVDDITELGDPVGMNPVNSAATIAPNIGAVVIPDLEAFEELSYEFEGNLYVKFVLLDMITARPGLWRALNGPDREVYFPQEHPPGTGSADRLHPRQLPGGLGVTVAGRPYPHLLLQLILSRSGWRYAEVAVGETFLALQQGLQAVLWTLGGVPEVVRSDNTSAATHEMRRSRGRLSMMPTRLCWTTTACAPPASIAARATKTASPSRATTALKDAIDQALIPRDGRKFDTADDYALFVRQMVQGRNRLALVLQRQLV